ncbi:MAG: T9SS type A sorting domain-containing protein [Bacteroidales bacterium]|nr:T9SS type A sorting domain-containing protein [Bacteroidales bacterium]
MNVKFFLSVLFFVIISSSSKYAIAYTNTLEGYLEANTLKSGSENPGFHDNYVTIVGEGFTIGNENFRPLSLNYVVTITKNYHTNTYYLSPHWNYSSIWGYPNTGGDGRFIFSSTDDEGIALQKLKDDMQKISDMGFNVVRIAGCGMNYDPITDKLIFPTNNYTVFYQKMEELLSIIDSYDLKAIWVLTADAKSYQEPYIEQYKDHLNKVSSHFKDNKTIMGYVAFAEPFYSFTKNNQNDKIVVGNWVNEWYYIVKSNAPNHLFSLGLQHPETVINWDYGMMMTDFMSTHFYAWRANVSQSNNKIATYCKWMSDNYEDIWIMAETGYSGTNITNEQDITTGTEQQQKDFAAFHTQRTLDCECKGYSWWQYQDLDWRGDPSDPYWENHLGLITRWPAESDKKAVSVFANYDNLTPNSANCTRPSTYYNVDEGTNYKLYGRVVDQDGVVIPDAVVIGWTYNSSENKYYIFRTFTRSNGYFYLYANQYPLTDLWISGLGYEAKIGSLTSGQTYTLNKINKNNWTKRYTNNADNWLCGWYLRDFDKFFIGDFDGDNKEELLCIQVTDISSFVNMYNFDNGKWTYNWTNNGNNSIGGWNVRSFDKFFVGDFDGDGKDELHCIQVTSGTSNFSTTLNFDNGTWSYAWSNYGNNSIGGWYIRSYDDFVVGDFDGDNKEELLCYNKTDNHSAWALMLHFENGTWNWGWSNGGNDYIGDWNIKASDKFYCGDINGDNRDELLCAQYTGGSNDVISFYRYSTNWSKLWSNYGSNSVGIYPYRNKLVVGNFDTDISDEILGVYTWATKFDFINSSLLWSWSAGSSSLSDWNINYSANCFFIHTIDKAPDYLFVIEKPGSSYSAEMFSMNTLIQGSGTSLKSGISENNNEFVEVVPDSNIISQIQELKVFPNPAKANFNIILPDDAEYTIDIIDVNGKTIQSLKNMGQAINIDCSNIDNGIYLVRAIALSSVYQQTIIISK